MSPIAHLVHNDGEMGDVADACDVTIPRRLGEVGLAVVIAGVTQPR
jgi:hypothetical protein